MEHGLKNIALYVQKHIPGSSSNSLVITSRWFATRPPRGTHICETGLFNFNSNSLMYQQPTTKDGTIFTWYHYQCGSPIAWTKIEHLIKI